MSYTKSPARVAVIETHRDNAMNVDMFKSKREVVEHYLSNQYLMNPDFDVKEYVEWLESLKPMIEKMIERTKDEWANSENDE